MTRRGKPPQQPVGATATRILAHAVRRSARGTLRVSDARALVNACRTEAAANPDSDVALTHGRLLGAAAQLAQGNPPALLLLNRALAGDGAAAALAPPAPPAAPVPPKPVLPAAMPPTVSSTAAPAAAKAAPPYLPLPRPAPALPGQTLPPDAQDALRAALLRQELLTGEQLTFANVRNDDAGLAFEWTSGPAHGGAFMLKVAGSWLVTPVKVTPAVVDAAKRHMLAWFDRVFVPEMQDFGAMDDEVRAAREQLAPEAGVFPDCPDPHGLVDRFPLVFIFRNASGTDDALYLGFNPTTGEHEAYAAANG